MTDYKKAYFMLFNAVTDAIEMLEEHKSDLAVLALEKAQRAAEELLIADPE